MMYDYVNLWPGKLICGLVLIKIRKSEAFRGIQDKKKKIIVKATTLKLATGLRI